MLSKEYCKELLNDFQELNEIVGAAKDLSDRGWDADIWCNDTYKEVIEDLYIKYFPGDSFAPVEVDDYLQIENKLIEFLKTEILEIME